MSKPTPLATTLLTAAVLGAALSACAEPSYAAEVPPPKVDAALAPGGAPRTVVLAAGCFWCVEAIFEQLRGVTEVTSGYAGGPRADASYDRVSAGRTDHAEAVRITYDPAKISYGTLLRVFFATQDPTTPDRQGPDRGRQYRSAIFFANDEERRLAEAYIAQLDASKVFPKKIVTTLEPLGGGFFPAEDHHQDFVSRNPTHPYVVQESLPRSRRVRALFPELLAKP